MGSEGNLGSFPQGWRSAAHCGSPPKALILAGETLKADHQLGLFSRIFGEETRHSNYSSFQESRDRVSCPDSATDLLGNSGPFT